MHKADGFLSMCPFCRNREKDKGECTLCGGAGVLIKVKTPPKSFTLCVIKGGKG